METLVAVMCMMLVLIVALTMVASRQHATINRLKNYMNKQAMPSWIVHQVRKRYISGSNAQDLADKYKVSRGTILNCVRYWTHKKVSPELRLVCLDIFKSTK